MVKIAFLLFLLGFSFHSFSQAANGNKRIINLKDALQNNAQRGKTGDEFYNDADAFTQGIKLLSDAAILYLPPGNYTIRHPISLYKSGIHIRGAGMGKTIIRFDSLYKGNGALFQSNGASNIIFENITFTGNAKQIKAVLEFNSFPNQCRNIQIINCGFINLWTEHAINFGGTGANETHSTDNVLIEKCRFYNIYNPSYKIVTNDTDPKCNGINLQQTTLRAEIRLCRFENISGDGIFGWGSAQKQADVNPYYGNWNIHNNFFTSCWMGVEINGGAMGSNLNVHDNEMRYSTRNGGFLISVDSYKARVVKNKLYNVDRGLIECTAIGGIVSDNTGTIVSYSNQPGSVPASEQVPRVACLELYGYDNLITRNQFTLSQKQPHRFSQPEFNGIKLIGKTTDPQYQPLSYKGITDYSAYWTITQNTITGFTHKAIDATNDKIRNVMIKNNVFKSGVEKASPIEIYGYYWQIADNTFDLTGSMPTNGNYVIRVFYLQKDKTESVVLSNKIMNDAWLSDSHKYKSNNF